MKKVHKDFWEKLFVYPSFNIRFGFILILVLLIFLGASYSVLFKAQIASNISDQIAVSNLIVQGAMLILGIFAAYYALRQLVETRFTSLDEAGMQELKRNHYSRAFEKWKEAFYIKPEAGVFTNMCESLLLIGDHEVFDQYIHMSQQTGFLKKEIFQEVSDQLVLLYLRSIRHLLVRNQGEAEKCISNLVGLVKEDGLIGFQWDFIDLQSSVAYQDLSGECKIIAENLINYLKKTMPLDQAVNFEKGNYAAPVK